PSARKWFCAMCLSFFFQAEAGIRGRTVTGVQTCALPISVAVSCLGAFPRGWLRAFTRVCVQSRGRLGAITRATGSGVPLPHRGLDRKSVVEGKKMEAAGQSQQHADVGSGDRDGERTPGAT